MKCLVSPCFICPRHTWGHLSKPLVVFAHVRCRPLAGESMWKMSLRGPRRGGIEATLHPHIVAGCGALSQWGLCREQLSAGQKLGICPTIKPVFLVSLLAVRTWQMPPAPNPPFLYVTLLLHRCGSGSRASVTRVWFAPAEFAAPTSLIHAWNHFQDTVCLCLSFQK